MTVISVWLPFIRHNKLATIGSELQAIREHAHNLEIQESETSIGMNAPELHAAVGCGAPSRLHRDSNEIVIYSNRLGREATRHLVKLHCADNGSIGDVAERSDRQLAAATNADKVMNS